MLQHLPVIWWEDIATTSSLVTALNGGKRCLQFPPRYQYIMPEQAVCFLFFLFTPSPSTHFCPVWSYICSMWYFKTRYLSINTRACLYALKCKFIFVVFSVHFRVLRFAWSFLEISEKIFSIVCTVYMNGSFLSNFNTLWLNLQSQWWPQHFVVLWSWRYIWLAVSYRQLSIWNKNSYCI